MKSADSLTLPDHIFAEQRTHLSLAEIVKHCANKGASPEDALDYAWNALEQPGRPNGLTIVPEAKTWKSVGLRTDSDVPVGALTVMLKMRPTKPLRKEEVMHFLWIKRALAVWVDSQLKALAKAGKEPKKSKRPLAGRAAGLDGRDQVIDAVRRRYEANNSVPDLRKLIVNDLKTEWRKLWRSSKMPSERTLLYSDVVKSVTSANAAVCVAFAERLRLRWLASRYG